MKEWGRVALQAQFPGTDYGVLGQEDLGIYLIPVDLAGLSVDSEVLSEGLLRAAGFEIAEISSRHPHTQGTASGEELRSTFQDEGQEYSYIFRILKNQDVAFILTGFVKSMENTMVSRVIEILDAFKITEPLPADQRSEEMPTDLNHTVLNHIGLTYYGRSAFAEARPFFIAALDLAPDQVTYFENAINCDLQRGAPEAGYELLQSKLETFKDRQEVQILAAPLLRGMGQNRKAAEFYAKAFAAGHRNEDDLLSYLGLLTELGDYKTAIKEIDAYLGRYQHNKIRPRRWQHQIYRQADKMEEGLRLAEKLADEFPENEQIQRDLVEALIDAEKSEEALEKLSKLIAAHPQDAELIHQRGQAHLISEDYRKAKESFTKALKLRPENPTYSQALSIASALLGQGDQSSIRDEIAPVPIPPELAKKLAIGETTDPPSGFNTFEANAATGFFFEKGQPFKRTEYRTIRILNRAGVDAHKYLRFVFDPTYQRAYINEIVVEDDQGQVLARAKTSESYVSDNSAQPGAMATTECTVTAPVPGLTPGRVLRYSYTIEDRAKTENFRHHFNYFVRTAPCGPITTFVTGSVDTVSGITRGKGIKMLTGADFKAWLHAKPPRYFFEASLPRGYDYLPSLSLGDQTGSWQQLSEEYLEKLADRLTPSSEVTKLAAKLIKGQETAEEKAAAIFRHVQDRLSYQALEFGIRGTIPNRVEQILENSYGDCKDHSLLALQLFRAAGLDAKLALVHITDPVCAEIPSLDQFDHMILYAPEIRGGSFFDATAKNSNPALRSTIDLAERDALILDGENSRIQEIPWDPTNATHIISQRKVQRLPGSGDLEFKETVTFSGYFAETMRGFFKQNHAADHKNRLESFLGNRTPIKLQEHEIKNLDVFSDKLQLTLTYQIASHSAPSILPALWEDFYFSINQSQDRQSPLHVSHPVVFESEVTVDKSLTSFRWLEKKIEAGCMSFSLTPNSSGFSSQLSLKRGTYPPAVYPKYAKGLSTALMTIKGQAPSSSLPREVSGGGDGTQ